MTVSFDLPPQVEQAYRETAAAKGVAVDALVREVVIAAHPPLARDASQEERIPSSGGTLSNAERRQMEGRKSLVELFAESPFKGLSLEFDESERDKDFGRDFEL
jgi:hypothetical protein